MTKRLFTSLTAVVACCALLVALGGTAYAGSHPRKGHNHAGASKKKHKHKGKRGPRGQRGPQGAIGPIGPQGPQGPPVGPLPGARVENSSPQSIPGEGNETFLTWDEEVFDTGNVHSTDANTDRLTAPVTGTYVITVSVRWQSGESKRYLGIYDSEGERLASVSDEDDLVSFSFDQSVTTIERLTAGDYVRAGVFNYDTVAKSIDNQEHMTAFSMQMVSP
jgi:hypothetical protein